MGPSGLAVMALILFPGHKGAGPLPLAVPLTMASLLPMGLQNFKVEEVGMLL